MTLGAGTRSRHSRSLGRVPIAILFSLLTVVLLVEPTTASAAVPPAAPTAPSTLSSEVQPAVVGATGFAQRDFGVSLSGLSQLPQIATLSQELGRSPNIINYYDGWNSPFPISGLNQITATGAAAELTWEPWIYTLGLNQDT